MHYSIASLWLMAAISALAASSGTANVVLKPSTNGYAVFVNETSITLPSVELGGGSYTVEGEASACSCLVMIACDLGATLHPPRQTAP